MLGSLDEKKIAFQFNKAASRYDEAAVLQRAVGEALFQRLKGIRLQPQAILDLGCGTGYFTCSLKKAYAKAEVVGFDKSNEMLKVAQLKAEKLTFKAHWLCGQAETLPFANHVFDLIYSNLMLHWSTNFSRSLSELRRVLKPGGLLLFSMVGTDTLKELRYAWAHVDANPHVHLFPDLHEVGDSLVQTPFDDPVIDVDYFTLFYSDVFSLMDDLRKLGVQNLSKERQRGLTSKRSLQQLKQVYESFRNPVGKLPATWEIIYGHAWGPHEVEKLEMNEIRIPIQRMSYRNVFEASMPKMTLKKGDVN